ncbi:MAG: hypothetical protein KGD65_02165 [Candidatus Lokiarchaeota archaeon]|nr:hypothetical protein [Candidatus Lokiarchaeota archaeon]
MCSNGLGSLINGLKKAKNNNLLDKKLNFIIEPQRGFQSNNFDNLIVIGNCLKHLKEKGLFVPGCPPISSDLLETIKK